MAHSDLSIPDRWRSPRTFDFGSLSRPIKVTIAELPGEFNLGTIYEAIQQEFQVRKMEES